MDLKLELNKYLFERSRVHFDWGTNNCSTFAIQWISRVSARPVLNQFLIQRSGSAAETKVHLMRLGVKNIIEITDRYYSRKDEPELGDLVAFRSSASGPLEYSFGIFTGDNIAVMSERGIVFLRQNRIEVIWDIF